jgi:hypothetical protein
MRRVPIWRVESRVVENRNIGTSPPSKARGDPDYDDRMTKICQGIKTDPIVPIDIRELVVQTRSLEAAHEGDKRPTVQELLATYRIVEDLIAPPPQAIGILDDVLTAGTHFVAVRTILRQRFSEVPIYGIFIARRVFASPFELAD